MELRAEKISKDFLRYSAKNGYFIAVQETDLHLAAGTLTAVTGRSGSGKSTLLNMLGGLMKPVTGACLWMMRISTPLARRGVRNCAGATSALRRSS